MAQVPAQAILDQSEPAVWPVRELRCFSMRVLLLAAFYGYVANGSPCLCIFDVDETLTGHHNMIGQCPKDHTHYLSDAGHNMQLSDAAVHLSGTFCHDCYLGVISAGSAGGSGSEER